MKKSVYTLLMSCLVCFSVYAMYDEPIKVLRIFNGGVGTTIQLSHVDSLMHSRYDADSIKQSDYLQSVIYSLDSIYNIPTASIDSIVVEDVDVEEYQNNINSIEEYIDQQEELAVEPFQNNLLAWLNAQEWVDHAVINDERDFITVTMENGIETFVFFQDMSFFEDVEEQEEQNASIMAPRKASENNYYDVAYQNGEAISNLVDILYIHARTMRWPNNASEELYDIKNVIEHSPINFNLDFIDRNLSFTQKNWNDYGIIMVSQTHGLTDLKGGFQAEDKSLYWITNYGIGIYVGENGIIRKQDPGMVDQFLTDVGWVYIIKPEFLARKITNRKTIFFGNYCYSAWIAQRVNKGTIIGNLNKSHYSYNKNAILKFMEGVCQGKTNNDVLKYIYDADLFKWGFDPQLSIYTLSSLQRYFSISTEDVTDFAENGNAIVKGTINGYENLKKTGVNYYAYVLGKGKELNYADIAKGKPFTPNPDGSFSYECTDLPETEGNEYQVVIGFTYAGKTYYGEVKTFNVDNHPFCPDSNHPHIIDLGLPSGTKWACCNVGASRPEGYGGYYAWGETSEKSYYDVDTYQYTTPYYYNDNNRVDLLLDFIGNEISGTGYDVARVKWGVPYRMPTHDEQMDLMNNCTAKRISLNGVSGMKFTGPNGNSIFLPEAGYKWGESHYFEYHRYWSGTLAKEEGEQDAIFGSYYHYVHYAYCLGIGGSAYCRTCHRDDGFCIRPIADNTN